MALASCAYHYDCDFGSFSGSNSRIDGPIHAYMLGLSDDLVVDNLKEMERFLSSGQDAWTTGSTYTAGRDNNVKGAVIEKDAADSVWTIRNKTNYPLLGTKYPTDYSMTVRMLPCETSDYHDWKVTIDGTRQEKEGYGCRFRTDDGLQYKVSGTSYAWRECFGKLRMETCKGEKKLDEYIIILNGTKDRYEIRNIK